MDNEAVQHVPNAASEAEAGTPGTLTFVTTEGEFIVFEGMNVPVEEAAIRMGEEALTRSCGDVNAHADILRDGLLASGMTLEIMLAELRQRRETDSEK